MNKLQKKKSSRYLFNFKNEITTTCLLFTADWCEACKDIEPLFNNKYHKYKSTVNFKKINVDDEDTDYTTIQYKIVKIPTIIIIEDGKITDYINEKITEDTLDKAIMGANMELQEHIITNK
jgi:thioredoxin-like negative regulator of GroEL